ncbi:hypothetical protein ABZW11_11115 [Nonomuraea sp. NPDC004580]|uniref:hypothetical protein n=1 Tax=Nonomuraea sp. NPDC004580 TaxID=3154552 RepID=UPI0033BCD6B9
MTSVQIADPSSSLSESATTQGLGGLKEKCRSLLEQFNGWLQVTVPNAPHLVGIVPVVTQAIHLYRAGKYEACVGRVKDAAEILRLVGHPVPMNP